MAHWPDRSGIWLWGRDLEYRGIVVAQHGDLPGPHSAERPSRMVLSLSSVAKCP